VDRDVNGVVRRLLAGVPAGDTAALANTLSALEVATRSARPRELLAGRGFDVSASAAHDLLQRTCEYAGGTPFLMGVEDLPNSGKSRRASRLNRLIAAALYPTRNGASYEWGPDGRDLLHRFDPGALLSSDQLSSEQRAELSSPRGFALAVIRHGGKAFLDSGSFSYFTDLDRKTTTYDIRLFPRLALRCQEVRARADATYAYAITGTLVAVEAPPAAPPVAAWPASSPEPAAAPEPAPAYVMPYRGPGNRPGRQKAAPPPTSGDALQAYIDEKIKVARLCGKQSVS
jgi:hypothetical protein